jgi:ligand-binding sensor domain-containing protein/two-component sensor histidine kinase
MVNYIRRWAQVGWLALVATILLARVEPASGGGVNPAGELVIRSWSTEAGLPQNTVNAIVQTRDGYLWIGTRDGLARFDGLRFTVFGLAEGLPSVEVQTLYEDRKGTLWIGTSGGGLSRWASGRIETISFPTHLAASGTVGSLAEDASGRLWIGTRAGLTIWEHGRFAQSEELTALGRSGIRSLLLSRTGTMWIATLSQGLYEFRDNRLRESKGPFPNERILAYCLLEDSAGDLWTSVGNGTVLRLSGGVWHAYTETNGLPFAYITCLAQDPAGTLWAGSLDDGLFCFDGDRFHAVRKAQGLSANDIRSLGADHEGHLWVGTRTGGLNRLGRRKLVSYGAGQGLTNDYTRSVAETPDGVLWVGTTGGGLYRGGAEGFRSVAPYHASVESVLAARDGTLWWGAARGLLRMQTGGSISAYTNEPWLGPAAVTALAEDGTGRLWAGTSEGRLVCFQDGVFREVAEALARGPITSLAPEPGGALWVGSMAGGLRRFDPLKGSAQSVQGLSSQSIRTLHLDTAGTLWVGTAGGGLNWLAEQTVFQVGSREGLNADTVAQIVEDRLGFLWLGTSRGVIRVRKTDLKDVAIGRSARLNVRAFGINEGMATEECSSGFCPAGLRTRAGRICISTVKGLVLFDPDEIYPGVRAPRVLLEEVLVGGTQRDALQGDPEARPADPAGSSGPLRRLVLQRGDRELEMRYTAIHFEAPERLRFRYRLDGVDGSWIDAGSRRTAYYTRLPHGRFVFRVAAGNLDGSWSDPIPLLAVTVQPYVWETPWFIAAVSVGALGLLTGGIRLLERRRYRRRLALVETRAAVERERLRISQDMHDDIGTILTQVSQLSDLGQSETSTEKPLRANFEKIGSHARAAVQALDEIVWATNPKNDNLSRFAEYICRFADELFEMSPVRCWQDVPTSLPSLPLSAELRHNVFLALKEAFNNVLKHSGATEVWLKLSLDAASARVSVEDNGRGFDVTRIAPGGNGLENMRSRLVECGGRMELLSAPGQGTTVRFHFPLPAE